jgi:hypothetical protein
LKNKLIMAVRSSRKTFMRAKKMKKEVKKEEVPSETHSQDDDASSGSGADLKELSAAPKVAETTKPHNFLHNECIYDCNHLYEHITKLSNPNYAANQSLIWGKMKLQLNTRSMVELRQKFHDLNITLRQIGVDDEKSFIDERILLGERLLYKDY